jgi:hypothetical protein
VTAGSEKVDMTVLHIDIDRAEPLDTVDDEKNAALAAKRSDSFQIRPESIEKLDRACSRIDQWLKCVDSNASLVSVRQP